MREDDSNWFSKWEELPSPEELMSLSQTLITLDLDLDIAFDICNLNHYLPPPPPPSSAAVQHMSMSMPNSFKLAADLGDLGNGDEPTRTLKRPWLVWTPQPHKIFVDAVAHLGIKNAVPKTITQLMSVDGLTRENVASHLHKYRLYLKRMQQLSGGGVNGGGGLRATFDDHLFASSPVPPRFLHPGANAVCACATTATSPSSPAVS